jgi:hypothetical protein
MEVTRRFVQWNKAIWNLLLGRILVDTSWQATIFKVMIVDSFHPVKRINVELCHLFEWLLKFRRLLIALMHCSTFQSLGLLLKAP